MTQDYKEGRAEFLSCQMGHTYTHPLPEDVDIMLGYEVVPDHPDINYALEVSPLWEMGGLDTEGMPADWYLHLTLYSPVGGPSIANVSVMYQYTTQKKRTQISREPYSSMETMDNYRARARKKLMTTYREWPYCTKCHTEKDLVLVQEAGSGNVELVTYLECKC